MSRATVELEEVERVRLAYVSTIRFPKVYEVRLLTEEEQQASDAFWRQESQIAQF